MHSHLTDRAPRAKSRRNLADQFNFLQSRGAPERAGAAIWRGDRQRHERFEPQERPERLVSVGGATRVPTAPTPYSRRAPNRTKTSDFPLPRATPPTGELLRRRSHRAAPRPRRVHRPVREYQDERPLRGRRRRGAPANGRRLIVGIPRKGRTGRVDHSRDDQYDDDHDDDDDEARAGAGSRRRAHRALLVVPRRVRARPGLRGFPPLPRRVPMRVVRAKDAPVPRPGMPSAREGRGIRVAARRRPLPRPPRHHPGVALGFRRRRVRRVDQGPPRTEGAVLVVPGGSQARARARRRFVQHEYSCVASCVVDGSVIRSVIGVVLVRGMRATDGSMRDVRDGCARRRSRRQRELRLCQSRRRAMRSVPRRRVRLERPDRRQRATDQDRTRVVRVVRRTLRAPGQGQGARQVPVPGVRRGHRAVRAVPGVDANARAAGGFDDSS